MIEVQAACSIKECLSAVLILNQMEYIAGKNTSVRIVPAKVPPISVYARVPQNTECVRGMKASMAASAVKITGRARCTVASTTACSGSNPAWVINRRFDVLKMNAAGVRLLRAFCIDAPSSTPNLARLLLSPRGLRPYVENIDRVILHVLERILREVGGVHARAPGDEELLAEVLPEVSRLKSHGIQPYQTMLVPVGFRRGDLELNLFTAITTFGSPSDVTLQELRIETLFPLDEESRRRLDSLPT